ncbi:hypothetical protein [Tardiphaga sp.]|nr:hypothetical protein [Tardiphaga sp.]
MALPHNAAWTHKYILAVLRLGAFVNERRQLALVMGDEYSDEVFTVLRSN